MTFHFATATGSGTRSIVVVPIESVEPVEEDEYADLPIYERIQYLLLDLWLEQTNQNCPLQYQ